MKQVQNKENSWKIYQIVIDWIKFADTKAGVFFSINIALLALTVPEFIKNFSFIKDYCYILLFLSLYIILAIIVFFMLISCIFPRLSTNTDKKNLIFFGDIANKDKFNTVEGYAKEFLKDEDNLEKDHLLEQIKYVAEIANIKFNMMKLASKLFISQIIILIITLLLLLIPVYENGYTKGSKATLTVDDIKKAPSNTCRKGDN